MIFTQSFNRFKRTLYSFYSKTIPDYEVQDSRKWNYGLHDKYTSYLSTLDSIEDLCKEKRDWNPETIADLNVINIGPFDLYYTEENGVKIFDMITMHMDSVPKRSETILMILNEMHQDLKKNNYK